MIFFETLEAEKKAIQHQMVEVEKNKSTFLMKGFKRCCKKFGFSAEMPKDSLFEGKKKQ